MKCDDGGIYPIQGHLYFNCAGAGSGEVARMTGIGIDQEYGSLSVPLPIEAR